MKKIEKFVANDGSEFDNAKDCCNYEIVLAELDALFISLPKLPKNDGCRFANGNGYIQHDRKTYKDVEKKFYNLACEYHKGLSKFDYDTYGFWRTLDDSGSPFYSYGQRLLNTDQSTLREYGQGYYKNHPEECKSGQIN